MSTIEMTKCKQKIKEMELDLREKGSDVDRLSRQQENPETLKQQKEMVNQKI